jgi:hypothetical protein
MVASFHLSLTFGKAYSSQMARFRVVASPCTPCKHTGLLVSHHPLPQT